MKKIILCAAVALVATPSLAQVGAGGLRSRAIESHPATDRVDRVEPAPRGVVPTHREVAPRVQTVETRPTESRPTPGPVVRAPRGDASTRQDYLNAIHAAEARARNAVANGADPERVRAALNAYKQQLRERWNATH